VSRKKEDELAVSFAAQVYVNIQGRMGCTNSDEASADRAYDLEQQRHCTPYVLLTVSIYSCFLSL
jgi:hypothetical protein